MSFQQSADRAVAIGKSTPPRSGRFAAAVTGGVLIGAVLAGVAAAEPAKSENAAPGAAARSEAAPASGDWSLCRAAAAEVEKRISAPGHLLSALTLTETGRRSPGGKSLQAWPWTINVGGKGYVFTTKEEAVRAVRRLMAQGHRSIDVGCMQVNLKYHPRAFTSLEEAFDPVANLFYGADFLARLKRLHGSWELAVQHYHSYTEEHRQRYAARFRTLWTIERRRMAKAGGEGVQAATHRARVGIALARLPEIPRTMVRTALPDRELSRRLEPVAALMAFGINVKALGRTARQGNAYLRQLGGRYPAVADMRMKSAGLAVPVAVN